MRVLRIIPINDLDPPTFQAWADRIVHYLKTLPGTTLHLVFDDYRRCDDELYQTKGRPDKGTERHISDLSQKLPKLQDWSDFLTNDQNKLQVSAYTCVIFIHKWTYTRICIHAHIYTHRCTLHK